MINITFPDGHKKDYEKGITALDIAKDISISLAKKVIAASFNDALIELSRPLNEDGSIELLLPKDEKSFEVLNHSAAHLLAQAIRTVYPDAQFGVGPAIEEGFYYDVDFKQHTFTDADLPKIEKIMQKLSQDNYAIERMEVSYEKARQIFKGDPYKLELIEMYKEDQLSVYKQGAFIDLCRGGHVPSTSYIKHFKLLSIAGA